MTGLFYAGVGSRETPTEIQGQMVALAAYLAGEGWCLNSGGAGGADLAFEHGCDLRRGNKQIFIPWRGFNGSQSTLHPGLWDDELQDRAYTIAAQIHPNWKACSPAAKKLHSRNVFQVLGKTLVEPVKFVICWTKKGKVVGGTATAINLAKSRGIPVFNMAAGYYFHGADIYD